MSISNNKIALLVKLRKFLGTHQLHCLVKTMHFEQRRNQLLEHILHDKECGVTDEKYFDHQVIVSLTTYGKRLYDVAFTIESIMQQSVKANRIVLWLEDRCDAHLPVPAICHVTAQGVGEQVASVLEFRFFFTILDLPAFDLKALGRMVALIGFHHIGHLLTAGTAPGSPEVNEHIVALASPLAEFHRLSAHVLHFQICEHQSGATLLQGFQLHLGAI